MVPLLNPAGCSEAQIYTQSPRGGASGSSDFFLYLKNVLFYYFMLCVSYFVYLCRCVPCLVSLEVQKRVPGPVELEL